MQNNGPLALRLLLPGQNLGVILTNRPQLLPLTLAPAPEAIGKGVMFWIGTRFGGFVKILDCHNLVLSDRSRNLYSHLY